MFAYPLAAGLTTTRLALGVLSLIFIATALTSGARIYVSRAALVSLGLAFFAFFFASITLVFVGGFGFRAFSWLLLGMLSFLLIQLLFRASDDELEALFCAAVIASSVVLVAIYFYMLRDGVDLSGGFSVRQWFFLNTAVGLNRIMNGLVVCFGLCVGTLWFGITRKKLINLVAGLCSLLVLYLVIITGSRQSLLAVLFMIAMFGLVSILARVLGTERRRTNGRFIFAGVVSIIGLIAFSYNFKDSLGEWVDSRFINTLVEGKITMGDERRLGGARAALAASFENHGFGVGLGELRDYAGIHPHNGYLGVLGEMGWIGGGGFILLFFIVLTVSAFLARRNFLIDKYYQVVACIFFVGIVLMSNLNDLVREAFVWVLLGLFLAFGHRATSGEVKQPQNSDGYAN